MSNDGTPQELTDILIQMEDRITKLEKWAEWVSETLAGETDPAKRAVIRLREKRAKHKRQGEPA